MAVRSELLSTGRHEFRRATILGRVALYEHRLGPGGTQANCDVMHAAMMGEQDHLHPGRDVGQNVEHGGGAVAAGDVPSPLAGKVVSIDVKLGQQVEANAQLLTLEAMKMNTYVFAPAAGTVKEILVHPGDAVEEGRVLVKMSCA